jgi:hypothetical protein
MNQFYDNGVDDFIEKRKSICSSNLTSNSSAFFDIYRYVRPYDGTSKELKKKFENLEECFGHNGVDKPVDMTLHNTLWIETITNGGISGTGSILLGHIKEIASRAGIKYLFLYPSSSFGALRHPGKNRNDLIRYYKKNGFRILQNCKNSYDGERTSPFDVDERDERVKYHFMWANMDDFLVNDLSSIDSSMDYREKYIKYKEKYLNLKKRLQ